MADNPPKSTVIVLDGLKEIAAVLEKSWGGDVSVWRAWRLCTTKHDPLPHHKVGRKVRAFTDRVVAWAARQPLWRRQP